MALLIAGLVIFLAIHSVQIAGFKEPMAARLGVNGYKVVHSIVSLVGLVLIVIGYGQARAAGAPQIYDPPLWMRHVTLLLMMIASVLFVASFIPSRIKAYAKHPMLASLKVWALAHLLANGDLASLLLFGSLLAWAVVDRISLKRRPVDVIAHEKAIGAAPASDVLVMVLGATLYVAIAFWLHPWLIGVEVM
ncbi:NnrU family protein [Tepidamorphus sp. 3E244]|uniref:NnrU family protein n=1 Tax=Tepidamorphus sp. 3E244 TaxID=3385498 RepID=UPI0038FCD25F